MALVEIKTEQIYKSFFDNDLGDIESFGIDVEVPETIDKAFGIEGLNETIKATCGIAKWKMVVIEPREIDEGVNRRFAFDLTVGPRDRELRIRYFPYVPDDRPIDPEDMPYVIDGEMAEFPKHPSRFLLIGETPRVFRYEDTLRVIIKSEIHNGNIIFICEPLGKGEKQKVIVISPKDGLFTEKGFGEYKKEEEEVDNSQSSFI